jgi:hypothetical protein
MAVMEPQLAILRPGIGVTQVYLALPDGFNLRPLEHDPRLKGFLDKIVVIGLAIDGYYVGALRHMKILAPRHRSGNLRTPFRMSPPTSYVIAMPQQVGTGRDKQ